MSTILMPATPFTSFETNLLLIKSPVINYLVILALLYFVPSILTALIDHFYNYVPNAGDLCPLRHFPYCFLHHAV